MADKVEKEVKLKGRSVSQIKDWLTRVSDALDLDEDDVEVFWDYSNKLVIWKDGEVYTFNIPKVP